MDLRLWQGRFRDYLQMVKGWSPKTCETYSAELKPFFAFLERIDLASLSSLTRQHLEEYRAHLYRLTFRGRPLALSTQSVRLAAVRAFARFLFREQYLLIDVASAVELPRRAQRLPRTVLSERETLKLLEAPDVGRPVGLRDRAILELFYATGMRNSELRHLELPDVDWARRVVQIRHGKGNKPRVVPLPEEAEVWLSEYLARSRPHFIADPGEKRLFLGRLSRRLGRQYLARIVRQYAEQAGLTKIVTPHVLRHSCATHLLRRGAGVRHLQELLGHANLDTTQVYTRVEVSDLARVIQRFHPRERLDDDI